MEPTRVRIEIERPSTTVWPLLAEFRYWPAWGPSVRAVEVDAERVEPGLTGRVQTAIWIWLPFEITAVDPGRSWDWKVAGLAATGHRVEPLSSSRCGVEFSVPAPFGFYRRVLERGLQGVEALANDLEGRT